MWHMWGRKESYVGFFVGIPWGTRPLGRRRAKCEVNIKVNLKNVMG
jgi:hypothetical protein